MVTNLPFLVVMIISLIRTISYGVYCFKRTKTGGISVFVLALGIIICGGMVFL